MKKLFIGFCFLFVLNSFAALIDPWGTMAVMERTDDLILSTFMPTSYIMSEQSEEDLVQDSLLLKKEISYLMANKTTFSEDRIPKLMNSALEYGVSSRVEIVEFVEAKLAELK